MILKISRLFMNVTIYRDRGIAVGTLAMHGDQRPGGVLVAVPVSRHSHSNMNRLHAGCYCFHLHLTVTAAAPWCGELRSQELHLSLCM